MRIIIFSLVILSSMAFADNGTLTFQSGNVAYVLPWKMCLIVSGAVSLGLYLLRGGKR